MTASPGVESVTSYMHNDYNRYNVSLYFSWTLGAIIHFFSLSAIYLGATVRQFSLY